MGEWKEKFLNEIITLEYGVGLPQENRKNGDYPVYGSNGIVDFHIDFLVEGPGIIVGRKGSIGEICWSESNFWPIDTTYYVQPKNDVDLKWLYYKLKTLELQKLNSASGTPGLNRNDAYKIKISMPEIILEQSKIAEILTSIDNTIEQTEKIIAKYKRMKQGLLQDLLTKGIDENGNIRSEATHEFKDSPLGRIPVEWEVSTLSNAGKIISGTTPDTDNPNYWNGEIVWITPYDLSKTPRMFIKTSERKISKKGLSACFSSIIPPYSIVISSRAPIGYFAIPTVEYVINQGCKSIILNEKIDNKFLYYQLNIIVKSMKRFGSGTTFTEISKRDLGKIKFVFPQKLEEQKNIAEILLSIDLLIEKEETYLKKLISIKQGLMQDLLTGKVRVTHLLDKGGELSGCHS